MEAKQEKGKKNLMFKHTPSNFSKVEAYAASRAPVKARLVWNADSRRITHFDKYESRPKTIAVGPPRCFLSLSLYFFKTVFL